MMTDFERLQRLARERRCTVTRGAGDIFRIQNRQGQTVHDGRFATAQTYLQSVTVKPPDANTAIRILIAAANKRGFWVEETGEPDTYRLSLKRGRRTALFDAVSFTELIAWLDNMETQQ
jgi:hypothetical protein